VHEDVRLFSSSFTYDNEVRTSLLQEFPTMFILPAFYKCHLKKGRKSHVPKSEDASENDEDDDRRTDISGPSMSGSKRKPNPASTGHIVT
jgi:hypothetical protein